MRLVFLSCSTLVLASFALGCEEPVPPTPQGAFLVNFFDTGADCPHKSHQSALGVINATDRTTVAVDAVNGAAVSCTVKGAALGPFSVTANMSLDADGLTISVPKIDAKATEDAPVQGSVGFYSAVTGGDFFSSNDPLCDFYIKPAGPTGIGQGVKPGSAWLSFKCPNLVESNNVCAANESFVLIENCNQ